MKKRKVSPAAVIGLTIAGLLVLAALGYFLLVRPQRAEAARLEEEIAATQAEITRMRALTVQAQSQERIRVADLFQLSRAMPDHTDVAGVLLELNRIATETGIRFETISPQAAVPTGGHSVVPFDVAFRGTFYELANFLYRLRSLVGVRQGELEADGRLFRVNTVSFDQGPGRVLRASLTISAYVFAEAPPAAPAPAAPTDTTSTTTTSTETSTTSTETTPTTTTPTPTPPPPPPESSLVP